MLRVIIASWEVYWVKSLDLAIYTLSCSLDKITIIQIISRLIFNAKNVNDKNWCLICLCKIKLGVIYISKIWIISTCLETTIWIRDQVCICKIIKFAICNFKTALNFQNSNIPNCKCKAWVWNIKRDLDSDGDNICNQYLQSHMSTHPTDVHSYNNIAAINLYWLT